MDHWQDRQRRIQQIDGTHILSKPKAEQFTPGGTPQLYAVIECTKCGFGYAESCVTEVQGFVKKMDIGFFIDPQLFKRCPKA